MGDYLRCSCCFLLLVVHCTLAVAQAPSWVDRNQRSIMYPESEYLVAFYEGTLDKHVSQDEQVREYLGYAATDIAESVQVTIHSRTVMDVTEIDQQIQEFYNHRAALFSELTIAGLKTDSYIDEKARKVYALAYVRKADVLNYYRNAIRQKQAAADLLISDAKQAEASGRNSQAAEKYYGVMPLIRSMEQDQAIIFSLSDDNYYGEIIALERAVNDAVSRLTHSDGHTLEDACFFMVEGLKKQLNEGHQPVSVTLFTYQDTQMGSAFSARFGRELEQELVRRGFKIKNHSFTANDSIQGLHVLSGTYWKEGDKLRVLSVIRDTEQGAIVASAGAAIPIAWLQEQAIPYLPPNYDDALTRLKTFRKDEIINGGLIIDLMTSHGGDQVLFEQGDTLVMYVKANRECYIRVIYYQADGTKVLLQDDYPVTSDMVNRFIELPQKNIASPPFGVETLQLNAQTGKFPPLNITRINNYEYIDEGVEAIVSKTRGFQRLEEGNLAAEKRISVTTIPMMR